MSTKFAIMTLFIFQFAFAESPVFVFSGGGTPDSNHYSQYLQTKTLFNHLKTTHPSDLVTVRFGAGNNAAEPEKLRDVHKISHIAGIPLTSMQYGFITENQEATKQNFFKYMREILPQKLENSSTFFLFVSDHGVASDNYSNNAIVTWDYDEKTGKSSPGDGKFLTVSELRKLIKNNVGDKTTVFSMSQCYSGGFHQMSVRRKKGYPTADTKICGFTAVPEDIPASGCTPDVDGPNYRGYERYFTEQFSGKDVVTGEPIPDWNKKTVEQAHYDAAIQDTTNDIPLSTSEYYAWQWTRATIEDNFVSRGDKSSEDLRELIAKFTLERTQDKNEIDKAGDLAPAVYKKIAYLEKTIAQLSNEEPQLKEIMSTGSNADIVEQAKILLAVSEEIKAKGDVYSTEQIKILENMLKPFWLKSIEDRICEKVDVKKDVSFHRKEIIECAKKEGEEPILEKVKRYEFLSGKMEELRDEYFNNEKKVSYLRRVGIYRNIIAGHALIGFMGDNKAKEELEGLMKCESSEL